MPLSAVLSASADQRLVLSHYAPGEACRAHRHGETQASLLIAGDYVEDSEQGTRAVNGASLSFKPSGFEHQNQFGEAGALILCVHDAAAFRPQSYQIVACASRPGRSSPSRAGIDVDLFGDMAAAGREIVTGGHLTQPWLHEARRRLIAEPEVPVRGLARSMDLNPIYFARAFRKTFGRPPAEYRRDRRMARVINTIVRSNAPLADIACLEGFADQAHMSRAIRAASGWSPGALRRLLSG